MLANTPWVIDSVKNGEDGFTINNYTLPNTTGGNDIVSGNLLSYTTPSESNNGFNQAGRKATFYLRDLRGILPNPVPFTISAVYEDPNCYMVSAGGTLSIPIRKLFWIREREAGDASVVDLLNNLNALQPCVVWEEYYNQQTGNPAAGSVTLNMEPASNALDASLKVSIPSGVIGNALVGVKRQGENNILWSWHIWITDYDPDPDSGGSLKTAEASFMYRNLGALSGEQTVNDHTVGLYYQWGRKDPLRPKEIPNNKQSPSLNNLIHAINAPDVFFTGGSLDDRYTSSGSRGYQDDFLWAEYGDNHKSQYDPCPDGWRVPNLTDGKSLSTSLWDPFKRADIVIENGDFLGVLITQKDSPSPADILFLPAGGYYNHKGNPVNYKFYATAYNANTGPDKVNEHMGLHFTQSYEGGGPEQPIERAAAMPVRCIKR